MDQCDNCEFYRVRTFGTGPKAKTAGECRYSDPVAQGSLGVWPQVKADDWCGKYSVVVVKETKMLGEVPL